MPKKRSTRPFCHEQCEARFVGKRDQPQFRAGAVVDQPEDGVKMSTGVGLAGEVHAPDDILWVRHEVLRLKALMPHASGRTLRGPGTGCGRLR